MPGDDTDDADSGSDLGDAQDDELDEIEDEADDEGTSLSRLRLLASAARTEPGAREELLAALQADSEAWRLTALQGLDRLETAEDLAPLAASVLARSTDPFLQASARLILARAGRGDAPDLARRALGRRGLTDEARWPIRPTVGRKLGLGWPVRRLSVMALGHVQAPEARPALRAALATDPDWAVRVAAADALGRSCAQRPAKDDLAALEHALNDRRGIVRRAAAGALGREPGGAIEDAWDAWRVPGREPYFRYVAGVARREYRDELEKGTRDGLGRNWVPFGLDVEEEDAPEDVDPTHPLIVALTLPRDDACTRARDLVHQPAVTWPVDPLWPVCCEDYSVFHGHAVADVAPGGEDPDEWFLESLESDLPFPEEGLEELEAETYAFRCGWCGAWWTSYRE